MCGSIVTSFLCFCLCFASTLPWTRAHRPSFGDENPVVQTYLGKIRGSVLQSRLGERFYAFRGIRYARPPIGSLRFKAAQPIDAWNGTLDATDDGPMCPQPATELDFVSEDCLRLNVYSRTLHRNARKSVLVYIHPGAFFYLSGQCNKYAGPQSLMDRDIVLVTLNYRLGSLGFLSTGTAEAPGNNGLKDQVMALRWIQSNIANFGGDPDSVTIMGYSAGAMSVTLHMVSPMSKGLFHRAIVMSGAATAQWRIPNEQFNLARRQARVLGCTDESSVTKIMDCLNKADAMDMSNSLRYMFEFGTENPVLIWLPVIEPDFGQERFLTENPTEMIQSGRFERVPVLAGITKFEFLYPAITIIRNDTLRHEMDAHFNEVAPICFMYDRDSDRSPLISNELREQFLPERITNESLSKLNNLFSDSVIGFGMHRFVKLASRYTKVYYYQNSYVGRYSHTYYPKDKPYGTVHHDDLLYLFVAPKIAPMFTPNDPEHLTVERMTRMWTNFARKGNPNGPTEEYLKKIRWQPIRDTDHLKYLDIGNELVMKDNLNIERYNIWSQLFPISDNQNANNFMKKKKEEEEEKRTKLNKSLVN